MAPTTMASTFSPLRAVVNRLSSTPTKQLPHTVSRLAISLVDCCSILSAPENNVAGRDAAENAVLVHKLKTRISTLLQDRTPEGRWAAVVLVKAAVENGGYEILRGCEAWVRGILSTLSRAGPTTLKKLCIITLTRIFSLTRPHQTLLREITTPSLPPFVTACLNLVLTSGSAGEKRLPKTDSPLLETILHAFQGLLPHHPTIFRPFSGQLIGLLTPLIAATPSSAAGSGFPLSVSSNVQALARSVFVLLPYTAPKNTSSEEWLKTIRATISSAHRCADHAFRAVIEDWEPADPTFRQHQTTIDVDLEVGDNDSEPLNLPSWTGIYAGTERLSSLIQLLTAFIESHTSTTVPIPLGSIVDLANRISTVTLPTSRLTLRNNPNISREEREGLYSQIPMLHLANLNLLQSITSTLAHGAVSISQDILEQSLYIFAAEDASTDIRAATYTLLSQILPLSGQTMSKKAVAPLLPVFETACNDLILGSTATPTVQKATKDSGASADSFIAKSSKVEQDFSSISLSDTQHASVMLLSQALANLPTQHLPLPCRALIDRTAILTNSKPILLASVLNPAAHRHGKSNTKSGSSCLPFLARKFSGDADVESFLRPRMPVLLGSKILTSGLSGNDLSSDDDEEEDITRNFQRPGMELPQGAANPPPSDRSSYARTKQASDAVMHTQESQLASAASEMSQLSSANPSVAAPQRSIPAQDTIQNKRSYSTLDSVNEALPPAQSSVQSYDKVPSPSKKQRTISSPPPAQPVSSDMVHVGGPNVPAPTIPTTAPVALMEAVEPAVHGADTVVGENADGEEEDESDFEMPTLNMEADTDDEEDDDEDDGEE